MEQLEQLYTRLGPGARGPEMTLENLIVALLLAFVVGQTVAYVYHRTHSGFSYSRSFTQSLVLLVIISALVMCVIGNDIVAAFGLMGALAIIRFRNVLKDTRDTAFVFMALMLGMAVGAGRHSTALVGGSFALLIAAWLHATAFGTRGFFDGHLSYSTRGLSVGAAAQIKQISVAYCRRAKPVSVSDTGGAIEHVIQVRLRDRDRWRELLEHLRKLEGVANVSLVLRDGHAEL